MIVSVADGQCITRVRQVATADDLGPQLSLRLSYLLKRALVELEDLHREHLAPTGISVRELAVLLLLDAREPESQQQAARRLGVDRTTMVALVDALEDKGLVARRADAGDRRRNVIELTKRGNTTLEHATRASDAAEDQLLTPLSSQEAAQLREMLARIASVRAEP
jgi:DNA-binding MarR family transcriptional regulator